MRQLIVTFARRFYVRSLFMAAVAGALVSTPAAAAPIVGGFGAPRSGPFGFLQSPTTAPARLLMTILYPGVEFRETTELTGAFLAPLDVAILLTHTTSGNIGVGLSAGEQKALRDYVLGGGNVAIIGEGGWDDPTIEQSFFTPFDVEITGRVFSNSFAFPQSPNVHPITNGQYGKVVAVATQNYGWFSDLGGDAQPVLSLLSGQPVMAVIERGVLGPGSGAVVMVADGHVVAADVLVFSNLSAYLVPEPATWAMLASGAMALSLMLLRKRHARPIHSYPSGPK